MSVITSTVSKFIGVHITKSINKKRFLCEISEPSIASRVVKRRKTLQTQKHMYNYVSATTLRNYILDDPILDWFKYYGDDNGFKRDEYYGSNKYSYFRFMLQRGIEYESYVMKNLLDAYGDYISFVSPIGSAFSLKSVEKTKYLMITGSPIIYQANLINNRLNLFGVADLLVRQDYISKLFYINNDISTKETTSKTSTQADTKIGRAHV